AGIRIHVHQGKHDQELLPRLNEVLRGYPGRMPVSVSLEMNSGEIVQLATHRHKVSITPELRGRLDDLLGENSHSLLVSPPKATSGKSYKRSNQEN
ncbi:MAG: hypothetical protein AAF483_13935, partial [Planctomycetota bacterium]